jgi:hypothetical protein
VSVDIDKLEAYARRTAEHPGVCVVWDANEILELITQVRLLRAARDIQAMEYRPTPALGEELK